MELDRTAANEATAQRRARAAAAGRPCSTQRRVLDSAYRGPVGRPSWPISTIPVLPPTLAPDTVGGRFVASATARLIGDRAYDSDKLDAELAAQGIELIAPHKSNRTRAPTQDGRALRRYKRRWKIERLFAWLQNFRRILSRHEYHVANYLGFVHLGCLVILIRHF